MPQTHSRLSEPGRLAFLLLPLLASPALAQLDILQPPPSLPSLPEPPAIGHALLENPIPVVILAVALGLAAYAVCARLGRRRTGLIGMGVGLGLGALVLVVSMAVQTGREQVKARTIELVDAVAGADDAALGRLLSEDVRLFARNASAGEPKGQIISWIDTSLSPGSMYEVESHRIDEVQAEVKPSGQFARTRATVTVTPARAPPTRCICMLSWQKVDGEWVAVEVQPLWLQGWGEVSDKMLRTR